MQPVRLNSSADTCFEDRSEESTPKGLLNRLQDVWMQFIHKLTS